MASLKDNVKLFIVQSLACYDTPSQTAAAVKEEFGIEITRMQASTYDPTKAMGRNLSKKLRAVFDATREQFLKSTAEIPIAQQSYRLRVLQRTLTKVEGQGNTAMVAQLLEQAAKEAGGAFTNRRELTGREGGPIHTANISSVTDPIEAARIYRDVMAG